MTPAVGGPSGPVAAWRMYSSISAAMFWWAISFSVVRKSTLPSLKLILPFFGRHWQSNILLCQKWQSMAEQLGTPAQIKRAPLRGARTGNILKNGARLAPIVTAAAAATTVVPGTGIVGAKVIAAHVAIAVAGLGRVGRGNDAA